MESKPNLMSVRLVLPAVLGLTLLPVGRSVEAQSTASLRRIAFLSSDGQLSPTCTIGQPQSNVDFRAFLEGLHVLRADEVIQ